MSPVKLHERSTSPDPSFKGFLKERRAFLSSNHVHTIPVEGFDNRVIGEYHTPDPDQYRAYILGTGLAMSGDNPENPNAAVNRDADILIRCCDRLYGKGEDGSEVELPLWGTELARLFGIDDPSIRTARQAVLAIFAGNEGRKALFLHAGKVVQSSSDDHEDINEELGN